MKNLCTLFAFWNFFNFLFSFLNVQKKKHKSHNIWISKWKMVSMPLHQLLMWISANATYFYIFALESCQFYSINCSYLSFKSQAPYGVKYQLNHLKAKTKNPGNLLRASLLNALIGRGFIPSKKHFSCVLVIFITFYWGHPFVLFVGKFLRTQHKTQEEITNSFSFGSSVDFRSFDSNVSQYISLNVCLYLTDAIISGWAYVSSIRISYLRKCQCIQM